MVQRAYPSGIMKYDSYEKAVKYDKEFINKIKHDKSIERIYTNDWESIGPDSIGGRVTDIEMPSNSDSIIYVGTAAGGVFKSMNQGDTWHPIFDNVASTLSIGDIAIDPQNPDCIYVGTGESNAGVYATTYGGDGIYQSPDTGKTWKKLGLKGVRRISKIVVDPRNPNIIYAGAIGSLFDTTANRGIFKSTNYGKDWDKVLPTTTSQRSQYPVINAKRTGCIDLEIHPDSSHILYAAMWERIRYNNKYEYGGLGSAVYKSIDSGKTWTEIRGGLPTVDSNTGRISIAISKSTPSFLAALIIDSQGLLKGVFKSADSGKKWESLPLKNLNSSYDGQGAKGWWNCGIEIDPNDSEIVYALGQSLMRYDFDKKLWNQEPRRQLYSDDLYVDMHSLFFSDKNSNLVILGNDGGIFKYDKSSDIWKSINNNIAITQFYTCTYDLSNPITIMGGTQDNGILKKIKNWQHIENYSDGFYVYKNKGLEYYSRKHGKIFKKGSEKFGKCIENELRRNWNTPFVVNPKNPNELFCGSYRILKISEKGCEYLSDNLTGIDPKLQNKHFGTITTIALAPLNDPKYFYVGTDTGLVWIKKTNEKWKQINKGLPNRWVTRIAVNPQKPNLAIITFSGFGSNHIYKTDTFGKKWDSIDGDFQNVPINDVIIDPRNENQLFIASDIGVYYTSNYYAKNVKWIKLGINIPNVPVIDLDFNQNKKLLLAATHGRSIYQIKLTKNGGFK